MPKYEEGVIYLRHKVSGIIYPYSAILAKDKNIEPYLHNEDPEPKEQNGTDAE